MQLFARNLCRMKKTKMTKRRKKLILLFACGVLIGVCLEIIVFEFHFFHSDKSSEVLFRTPKITCLIILKHKHTRYLNSSKNTWLRHCDDYSAVNIQRPQKLQNALRTTSTIPQIKLFCSNYSPFFKFQKCLEDNDVIDIVAKSAWSGLCKALHIAHYFQNEWILIIPDTIIVLVENLKLFIRNLNSNEDHYYGYTLKNYQANYNTLSAGILLSKGSLLKLLKKFQTEKDCDSSGKHWRNEDLYLGTFLKEFGILPKDTRDKEGRGRFHGYNINNLLWPGKIFRLSDYNKKALYPVPKGFGCCSPFSITLDVSDPSITYKLYFFLYKTTNSNSIKSTTKAPQQEQSFVWKNFLRERGYNESAIENMSPDEYYKIWEKILPPEVMYRQMRDFINQNVKN